MIIRRRRILLFAGATTLLFSSFGTAAAQQDLRVSADTEDLKNVAGGLGDTLKETVQGGGGVADVENLRPDSVASIEARARRAAADQLSVELNQEDIQRFFENVVPLHQRQHHTPLDQAPEIDDLTKHLDEKITDQLLHSRAQQLNDIDGIEQSLRHGVPGMGGARDGLEDVDAGTNSLLDQLYRRSGPLEGLDPEQVAQHLNQVVPGAGNQVDVDGVPLLGKDGLPLSKNALPVGQDGLPLGQNGLPLQGQDALHLNNLGQLVRRDGLPVLGGGGLPQVDSSLPLANGGLRLNNIGHLLDRNGLPVLRQDGLPIAGNNLRLNQVGEVVNMNGVPILAQNGLPVSSQSLGLNKVEQLVGRDGLPLPSQEELRVAGNTVRLNEAGQLVDRDNLPVLGQDGLPISGNDLRLNQLGQLIGMNGLPVLGQNGRPVLSQSLGHLVGRDGLPLPGQEQLRVAGNTIQLNEAGQLVDRNKLPILGQDGLPVMGDDLRLNKVGQFVGQDGLPLLGQNGLPILGNSLNLDKLGRLASRDGLPVLGQDGQNNLPLRSGSLPLLGQDGLPVLSKSGLPISEEDLRLSNAGQLVDKMGLPVVGQDGLPVLGKSGLPLGLDKVGRLVGRDGLPLLGQDGLPVLSKSGLPISQDDLRLDQAGQLVDRMGLPVLGQDGLPILGKSGLPIGQNGLGLDKVGRLVGRDGLPLMGQDGLPVLSKAGLPISQDDLRLNRLGQLVGSDGLPISGQDGLPVLDKSGLPIGQSDLSVDKLGGLVRRDGLPPVLGQDGLPVLDKSGLPISQDSLRLNKLGQLVGADGLPLFGQDSLPVLGVGQGGGLPLLSRDGLPLVGGEDIPILGQNGLPVLGEDGLPLVRRDTSPLLGEDGLPIVGKDGLPVGKDGLPISKADLTVGKGDGTVLESAVGQSGSGWGTGGLVNSLKNVVPSFFSSSSKDHQRRDEVGDVRESLQGAGRGAKSVIDNAGLPSKNSVPDLSGLVKSSQQRVGNIQDSLKGAVPGVEHAMGNIAEQLSNAAPNGLPQPIQEILHRAGLSSNPAVVNDLKTAVAQTGGDDRLLESLRIRLANAVQGLSGTMQRRGDPSGLQDAMHGDINGVLDGLKSGVSNVLPDAFKEGALRTEGRGEPLNPYQHVEPLNYPIGSAPGSWLHSERADLNDVEDHLRHAMPGVENTLDPETLQARLKNAVPQSAVRRYHHAGNLHHGRRGHHPVHDQPELLDSLHGSDARLSVADEDLDARLGSGRRVSPSKATMAAARVAGDLWPENHAISKPPLLRRDEPMTDGSWPSGVPQPTGAGALRNPDIPSSVLGGHDSLGNLRGDGSNAALNDIRQRDTLDNVEQAGSLHGHHNHEKGGAGGYLDILRAGLRLGGRLEGQVTALAEPLATFLPGVRQPEEDELRKKLSAQGVDLDAARSQLMRGGSKESLENLAKLPKHVPNPLHEQLSDAANSLPKNIHAEIQRRAALEARANAARPDHHRHQPDQDHPREGGSSGQWPSWGAGAGAGGGWGGSGHLGGSGKGGGSGHFGGSGSMDAGSGGWGLGGGSGHLGGSGNMGAGSGGWGAGGGSAHLGGSGKMGAGSGGWGLGGGSGHLGGSGNMGAGSGGWGSGGGSAHLGGSGNMGAGSGGWGLGGGSGKVDGSAHMGAGYGGTGKVDGSAHMGAGSGGSEHLDGSAHMGAGAGSGGWGQGGGSGKLDGSGQWGMGSSAHMDAKAGGSAPMGGGFGGSAHMGGGWAGGYNSRSLEEDDASDRLKHLVHSVLADEIHPQESRVNPRHPSASQNVDAMQATTLPKALQGASDFGDKFSGLRSGFTPMLKSRGLDLKVLSVGGNGDGEDPALNNAKLRENIARGVKNLQTVSGSPNRFIDLADLVNPFIGTEANNNPGNIMPGASVPFGMAKVTVDVDQYAPAGYVTNVTGLIRGMSYLHDSGTGSSSGSYGNFESMPITCPGDDFFKCKVLLDDRKRPRKAGKDEASPGYFSLTLNNGIKMETTATAKATLLRYTYPKGSGAPFVVQDWTNDLPGTFRGGRIDFDTHKGLLKLNGSWASSFGSGIYTYDAFACIDTSRGGKQKLGKAGLFQGDRFGQDTKLLHVEHANLSRNSIGGQPTQAGALFSFDKFARDKNGDPEILMRVGLSFNSVEQACHNAEQEIGNDWNFEGIVKKARDAWNVKLNRIQLDPKTQPHIAELFYSSLYYSFLTPNNATGEAGRYFPKGHSKPYYASLYCTWDTYRTFFPFLSLTSAYDYADIVENYVDAWRVNGWVPECRANNVPGLTQSGSHGVMVIGDYLAKYGDAVKKGLLPGNIKDAYDAVYKDAYVTPEDWNSYGRQVGVYAQYGYVPFGVFDTYSTGRQTRETARTVEYAHNDFGARTVALVAGHKDVADSLGKRSLNYRNTFDKSVKSMGFSNFVQQRRPDGSFRHVDPITCSPIDGGDHACSLQQENNYGVYETSSWEYSLYAPHDNAGLIELLTSQKSNSQGARDLFSRRLDKFFDAKLFYPGNEPSFQTPLLYHYINAPVKSIKRIRNVVYDNFNTTTGGLPGNSDSGATNTLLLFHLLGLYPVPVTKELLISSPFMPSYDLRNDFHGNTHVQVENFDERTLQRDIPPGARAYVEKVLINGKEHSSRCKIQFDELFGPAPPGEKTRIITLVMTDDEHKANSCGQNENEALPASLSTGGFRSF